MGTENQTRQAAGAAAGAAVIDRVEEAIAAVTAAQSVNNKLQGAFKVGSIEWHQCETIDDRLHDALTALGG